MSRQVLALSPHPDDESIGCGGTLRAHAVGGDRVNVVFLTSGEAGGHGRPPEETARTREAEAHAAARVLGLHDIEFWRQPDGKLEATEPLIRRLHEKLQELKPDIIYVTHDREMLGDHSEASELVRRALAGMEKRNGSPEALMFEVWTPLQEMDVIVDITPHVEIKRQAILTYKSQCDVMRFDEAALALNRYRGEMHSWPGGDYAEIFKKLSL